MNAKQLYQIEEVGMEKRDEVVAFLQDMREQLSLKASNEELPEDLRDFYHHYIEVDDQTMFAIMNEKGKVIGTIGIVIYDNRFDELAEFYQSYKTAEVVKCYIAADYRRQGIGTLLLDYAKQFSKEVGYDMLYLHSHPFLPGAIPFWRDKGFEDRLFVVDPVWGEIQHMDMKL